MPEVGEIKRAYEVGYRGQQKYIWVICPVCDKGRWICLTHTYKPEHTGICRRCLLRQGEEHPCWRGGQYVNGYGYVLIKRYGHPHANSQGYVKRARIVLEEKLGRSLLPNHFPHHLNGIKDDDRPENLVEILANEHQSLHMKLRKWKQVMGEATWPEPSLSQEGG